MRTLCAPIDVSLAHDGGIAGDFGLSEIKPKERAWLQDPKNGAKGTPLFMPPEVMMGQPFDEKSDVYRYN
jgi:serine/threonine protein kinase